jgi:hypothetical protein
VVPNTLKLSLAAVTVLMMLPTSPGQGHD